MDTDVILPCMDVLFVILGIIALILVLAFFGKLDNIIDPP